MPVYEYLCQKCGKEFEESQRITDKPLKKCKFCNGPVERLISRTSFALKGSGWFKDGYTGAKPDSGKADAPAKNPEKSVSKPEKEKTTGSSAKSST